MEEGWTDTLYRSSPKHQALKIRSDQEHQVCYKCQITTIIKVDQLTQRQVTKGQVNQGQAKQGQVYQG